MLSAFSKLNVCFTALRVDEDVAENTNLNVPLSTQGTNDIIEALLENNLTAGSLFPSLLVPFLFVSGKFSLFSQKYQTAKANQRVIFPTT